jgi:hypothetical protein
MFLSQAVYVLKPLQISFSSFTPAGFFPVMAIEPVKLSYLRMRQWEFGSWHEAEDAASLKHSQAFLASGCLLGNFRASSAERATRCLGFAQTEFPPLWCAWKPTGTSPNRSSPQGQREMLH